MRQSLKMSINPGLKMLCRRLSSFTTFRNVSRQLSSASTADPKEISVFNNLSEQWWDERGEFKPLHSMNKIRIPFIRNGLINSGRLSQDVNTKLLSLSGVKILDVGCGGGILSEPLARIGADVTGLDASQEAIRVAKEHAALEPGLSERLNYIHGTLEELNSGDYDAVVASEVIEHMTNANQCVALCSKLLKPGGSLFVTTLNRTMFSWLGGIVAAEYILRIVPPGTHNWNKFITPQELRKITEDNDCSPRLVHGMAYNMLTNEWCWSSVAAINYALHAVKDKSVSEPKIESTQ